LLKAVEGAAELLDVLVAPDDGNGANGSDPNGSDANPSLAELFCFSFNCLNFRLEKGSKESSRFSVAVGPVPPNGAKGSARPVDDGVDEGHVEANGSVVATAAAGIPPRRLNGSCPPEPAAVVPNAAVTGAVNGSSLS